MWRIKLDEIYSYNGFDCNFISIVKKEANC